MRSSSFKQGFYTIYIFDCCLTNPIRGVSWALPLKVYPFVRSLDDVTELMSTGRTCCLACGLLARSGTKGDFKNPREAVGEIQLCRGLSVISVLREFPHLTSSGMFEKLLGC